MEYFGDGRGLVMKEWMKSDFADFDGEGASHSTAIELGAPLIHRPPGVNMRSGTVNKLSQSVPGTTVSDNTFQPHLSP
jgi:hypothetical protein